MYFEKRPRGKQILPTHCHFCDPAPKLLERKYRDTRPFKGEEFSIPCRDLYCPNCEAAIVPDQAVQDQLEALVLAYQHKHDLLTAEEIKTRRQALGLSQVQFCAKAKGVPSATLKRVETGANVQDASTDQSIRIALQSLEAARQDEEKWSLLHKAFECVNLAPVEPSGFAWIRSSDWVSNRRFVFMGGDVAPDREEPIYQEVMTA